MARVFVNIPGYLGLIPGRVIPRAQKMVRDASLLNTQQYRVQIKGKRSNLEGREVPSPTLRCSIENRAYGRPTYMYITFMFGEIYIR